MICDKSVESALWCGTAGARGCPCSLLYIFIFTTAKSLRPPPPRCGLQPSPLAPADRLPASTLKEFRTSSPDTLWRFVTRWYFERDTSPCQLMFTVRWKQEKTSQQTDTNWMWRINLQLSTEIGRFRSQFQSVYYLYLSISISISTHTYMYIINMYSYYIFSTYLLTHMV